MNILVWMWELKELVTWIHEHFAEEKTQTHDPFFSFIQQADA